MNTPINTPSLHSRTARLASQVRVAQRDFTQRDFTQRGLMQRGFTLIEIMVVVIIIGLLAAVVVPQFLGRVDDARVSKAKQDIQAMETALTLFKLDNFIYPSTEMGLKALVEKPDDSTIKNWREGGYLKHLNKDPWQNDYQYINPGTHGGDYDLFSLGADSQPGGEKYNADLGNWNLDQ